MKDYVITNDIYEIEDLGFTLNNRFESIVVLGASGMLGGYIVESFSLLSSRSSKRPPVFAVCRRPSDYLQGLCHEYGEVLSVLEYSDLVNQLQLLRNVLVVHCASPSSVQAMMSDGKGAIFANIELTTEICKTLLKIGGHLVFLSSGEVNGFNVPTPIIEDSYSGINHLTVRGVYPELKKAAETVIYLYANTSKSFTASILRVSHTFGPGLSLEDPRIFGIVMSAIYRNKPIQLRSTGETMRTFMYSSDLFTAILKTSTLEGFNYFNVAGSGYMSVLEFCQIAARKFGVKIEIMNSADKESTPRNPQDGLIDTTKVRTLGWTPRISTEDAMLRTLASTRYRMSPASEK